MSNNDKNAPHKQFDPYDPYSQYICGQCGEAISPFRPPIYNSQNCSCSDLAKFANGDGTQNVQHDEQFDYGYTATVYHQPESYTSEKSAQSPEGPENREPNLQIGNSWIQLTATSPGLNENYQHSSTPLNFAMERYLNDHEVSNVPVYSTEVVQHSSGRYLELEPEPHVGAPTTRKRNTNSRPSTRSTDTGELLACSWTWDIDPLTKAGGWQDAEGNLYEAKNTTELSLALMNQELLQLSIDFGGQSFA